MTKKKKIWIAVIAVVVLAVVVVANMSSSSGNIYDVQAEKVKKGEIVSLVTGTGTVEAKTTVKVSADVSAKIVELPVVEGDTVKAGDILLQLDQTRYLAAVRQAEASLSSAKASEMRAKASMVEADNTYKRNKKLYERELISIERFEQINTLADVANANYESSKYFVKEQQAYLAQRRDDLSKTTILAPVDGTITDLNAEIGEIVMIGTMNNAGTVIMTVADLSVIEIEVEIDETDIAKVKLNQEASIEVDAFPDTTFRGIVTEVGNSAQVSGYSSSDRVTNFLVKVLLIDDVPEIKPGMTATADITTDKREDILKLPIQSVVFRPEDELKKDDEKEAKSGAIAAETSDVESEKDSVVEEDEDKEPEDIEGVFVIRDDQAIFVRVVSGISDQQDIEIISGIEEGDQVITGSYKILRTLKDGSTIRILDNEKQEN